MCTYLSSRWALLEINFRRMWLYKVVFWFHKIKKLHTNSKGCFALDSSSNYVAGLLWKGQNCFPENAGKGVLGYEKSVLMFSGVRENTVLSPINNEGREIGSGDFLMLSLMKSAFHTLAAQHH